MFFAALTSLDNSIENLEWATNKENSIHKFKTSLPKPYEELKEEWNNNFEKLNSINDIYDPNPPGGSQTVMKNMKVYVGSQLQKSMNLKNSKLSKVQ